MAYTKHTWQARQGTDLSKFTDTISGNTLNLVSAANITQAGTPISADWLNEMEQGIYDGNALIFAAAPTTSTVGAVGQIGVYNGDAYVCTAAANNVYTWIKVGAPTHTETAYTGNDNTATMCVDVYGDGRVHLYGRVEESGIQMNRFTADGALYRGQAEVIPLRQSYSLSGTVIKSAVFGGTFIPATTGTAHFVGIQTMQPVSIQLGYLAPDFFTTTDNTGGVAGGTLYWYYDIWGIKNGN